MNRIERLGVSWKVGFEMQFEQRLDCSSVAMRHLLESRLHMLAAVEAMADTEEFLDEYHRAVDLRDGLDELVLEVEDKNRALCRGVKDAAESNSAAE
jgi:hypothetical protein